MGETATIILAETEDGAQHALKVFDIEKAT